MNNLTHFITQIEQQNLPCRYTISKKNSKFLVSAKIETPSGEKFLDCMLNKDISQPILIDKLKQLLPTATICLINDQIFIDNLK